MEAAVRLARFALGLALAAAPMVASAATVTVGDSTASWSSTGFTHGLGGQGTERLSWGRPHSDGGGQQSYYDFDPLLQGTGAAQDTSFLLGTFTHGNFAIRRGADGAISPPCLISSGSQLRLGEATKAVDVDWLFSTTRRPTCDNPAPTGLPNTVSAYMSTAAPTGEFRDADSDTLPYAFRRRRRHSRDSGVDQAPASGPCENQAN
jgi:hypothetical protein